MYRIDIGLDPDRGYAALLFDATVVESTGEGRMKGIRGNSIEQLMSRIRRVIIDEEGKRRRFPLEIEKEPARIISPNGFE